MNSLYDWRAIIQDIYDSNNRAIRIATAAVISGTQEVLISHDDDSIKIGDGTDLLAVNTDGTITVQPGNTQNTTPWLVDTRRGQTILFASVSIASSGANLLVSASATKKIKVLHYTLVADAAVTVKFQSGSTDLTGAMSFSANGGTSSPTGTAAGGWLLETAVNEALNLNLGGAVGVRGHISYFLEA
ncbi:MAG: hypothetical protein H0X02_07060 [Nitrosomonas sp.]|nr:hypothetical protein [Nitrosomonas sp.]